MIDSSQSKTSRPQRFDLAFAGANSFTIAFETDTLRLTKFLVV